MAVVAAVTASTTLLGIAGAGMASAETSCTANVGNSGLSAAVVAKPHQMIAHRTIDATGCDIGIYIGQGASHVRIMSVTVTGANFQGIFAEKTSDLAVLDSTVTGNGFNTIDATAPALPGSGVQSFVGQAFGISVFGVSHALIGWNQVYNNGRGGIGVMDNGPNDPGIMMSQQDPTAPVVPSSFVAVVGNKTWANYNGCGIVSATQNVGGSLSHLMVAGNTIQGTGFAASGPDIGGIVVAADLPGSWVKDANVFGNRVTDSFEGGIIVNAEAPTSMTHNVRIMGNTVSANNTGHLEAPNTVGVIVFAGDGARNTGTMVWNNSITDQYYGAWVVGQNQLRIFHNHIEVTAGGVPVFYG
jgi:hypothetical protein